MTYQFTEDEIAALQAAQATGDWGHAYRVLFELISLPDGSGPKDGVSNSAWLWIDGAHDVNQDIGDFAAFIREYTYHQMTLRLEEPATDDRVQEASDRIASSVFNTILENVATGGPAFLPSIYQLGLKDAAAIAADVFDDDSAGWAGNGLFMFLGEDTFYRDIIINGQRPTYNILAHFDSTNAARGSIDYLGMTIYETFKTARGNDVGLLGIASMFFRVKTRSPC